MKRRDYLLQGTSSSLKLWVGHGGQKVVKIFLFEVNHGQVASGELPDGVITDDIDPELSEEEAHT